MVLFSCNLNGQNAGIDSVNVPKMPVEEEFIHSPKKAAIYSAVLPGLGQAYNKKYWKIPLVYAGFGTIGYFVGWNNRYYKIYKQAYSDLTDTDQNTNSHLDLDVAQYYNLDNPTEKNNFKTGLLKQQNYLRRNRDLLVIIMAGFYGLNIIDASVDAHLFDFDISEDLTMNWQPIIQPIEKQWVMGASFSFKF